MPRSLRERSRDRLLPHVENQSEGSSYKLGEREAVADQVASPATRGTVALHVAIRNTIRKTRQHLQGWRFGVACSALLAGGVLVVNIALSVYAVIHYRETIYNGVGTALVSSCKEVATWSTWLHLLINILSSVMLSASNYTMQCLSAPTRAEVDRAHASGDWLDVGIASVRNLRRIAWSRVCLWWLLGLSSIPIHFIYNSAIFKTTTANNFMVAIVNEDFLTGEPYLDQGYNVYIDQGVFYNQSIPLDPGLQAIQMNASSNKAYQDPLLYERLENIDCIKLYGTSYISDRIDVLAITSARSSVANQTAFWTADVFVPSLYTNDLPYGWVYDTWGNSSVAQAQADAANWNVNGLKIDYCLSRLTPGQCTLDFSVNILITVMIMNFGKCLAMVLVLLPRTDATLVTIGDALSSFLSDIDESTVGRCMMTKDDVCKGPESWSSQRASPAIFRGSIRRRWFVAASAKRWFTTLALVCIPLAAALVLLITGYNFLNERLNSGEAAFALGFGAVDFRAIIVDSLPQTEAASLVVDVLIANLPQVLCSFVYFAYNGLFTCMLLAHEYSQHGLRGSRKPLRVSKPKGKQRDKYFLQLPYAYSIPLILISTTLHWLISQSLFLVRIKVLQHNSFVQSQLGFSCAPILATIITGTILLIAAPAFGYRRLASHLPVASSCSAALSASCHRPKEDFDAAYLPVGWGAVGNGEDGDGHCCFTSEDTHELVPGKKYA
ncbi:hypothetical protein LTR29_017860 [Friedmanniomyces endolithicus]|nr:hypothetical protein LTR29_017860 [Friedmanniomyces endolithicus]